MNTDMFRLSLQQMRDSDWALFEKMSSCFLVSEYEDIRTMAHPSGDGGRDSELFHSGQKPFIVFQYSISSDWRGKIGRTYRRLSKEFPEARFLIYMTNQVIGGKGDELKSKFMQKGLGLDIRDMNWFIERANTDPNRENSANEIVDKIARPFLRGEEIIEKASSPLSTKEAKAALLYLGLQLQDDLTAKGLTKVSFDALVRATLRPTDSNNRLTRGQIHEAIHRVLPSSDKIATTQYIDAALKRLAKRYIRWWQKDDTFCLTHEETIRIEERLANAENNKADFEECVLQECVHCLSDSTPYTDADIADIQIRVPRIIEKFMLHQGEEFAAAVRADRLNRISYKELLDIILADIDQFRPQTELLANYPKLLSTIIQNLMGNASASTCSYLRRLSNSYTLLSFLNQTPDVQAATRKLFSHGKVWLDTTVLLPLFAEQLQDDENSRKFSTIFGICSEMGVEFRVTTGIIQEVNAHMNKALSCSRHQPASWVGRVPYLYHYYLQTGKPGEDFSKWVSLFRGDARQEDDLAQFLQDEMHIQLENLEAELDDVPNELRWAADRLWTEAHKKRRKDGVALDDDTIRILIKHDIETYLGVYARRQNETVSELGYKHWLLTFDKNAWAVRDALRQEFQKDAPGSPLLSITFLINSMNFGPARSRAQEMSKITLPVLLDIEMKESMPHDILVIADSVRKEHEGLPEYVIRRKVRDAIDYARKRKACTEPEEESENEPTEN